MELVAEGLNTKQVAVHMELSEATVRHYLSSVFTKLGVDSRVGAAACWLKAR